MAHALRRPCVPSPCSSRFALTAAAPAAGAQAEEEPDNIVVLTGRAEVRAGETVDNVIIFDGPVVVEGTVNDALVAFNGDVLIRGTAREDVVAADGTVTVADGGRIEGDVVPAPAGHRGRRPPRWVVGALEPAGVEQCDLGGGLARRVAGVHRSSLILGLLLGLLAPRAAVAVDAAAARGMGRWSCGDWSC